jgi:hypothetical protein
MSKERFIERQAEVRNAAARLQEGVAQPESSIVRDAGIQRFEFLSSWSGRPSSSTWSGRVTNAAARARRSRRPLPMG